MNVGTALNAVATAPAPGAALPLLGRLRAALAARFGRRASEPNFTDICLRLNEASGIWTAHIGLAQTQMRDATAQLLNGFTQILDELDQITDVQTQGGQLSSSALDDRADLLEKCEAQLRGLIENFHGFVLSREQVTESVRSLASTSSSLGGMAEDVARLARQTNLLSLNAAIEAARAGSSGRGFNVVAAEVRRLSSESGDTGKRIGDQVNDFSMRMKQALKEASEHNTQDAAVISASEQTVNQVVEQVDAAVSQLHQRAAELSTRGATVRAQVQQLMIAFQFQDRVHQIMDQVCASIHGAVARLQECAATGTAPDATEWAALLSTGYTTEEQHAVAVAAAGSDSQATPASRETTFF